VSQIFIWDLEIPFLFWACSNFHIFFSFLQTSFGGARRQCRRRWYTPHKNNNNNNKDNRPIRGSIHYIV
jgi:hypothetical protein